MKTVALLALAASRLFAQALIEGNASSTVRVQIWEDLQCPDCADFRVMLDKELLPKFKGTVAFEHHDFPLPKHAWARKAAAAARYFESVSPQVAVEFRQTTMANQTKITPENFDISPTSPKRTRLIRPKRWWRFLIRSYSTGSRPTINTELPAELPERRQYW